MARWIVCGESFIIGDVVRWAEPVWMEKGKRKKKVIKVGTRRLIAEVRNANPKDWIYLSVLKCEIPANLQARVLEPYPKGELLRRKRKTIGRGGVELRLHECQNARGENAAAADLAG